jgi:sulfur-carrier protein
MSVTVKLPTILRKFSGDEARVGADGGTLAEVLKDLESR